MKKTMAMMVAFVMGMITLVMPIEAKAFDAKYFSERVEEIKQARRDGEVKLSDDDIIELAQILTLCYEGDAEVYYKASKCSYGPYAVNVIAVVFTDKVTYVQMGATSDGRWDINVDVDADADQALTWRTVRFAGYELLWTY